VGVSIGERRIALQHAGDDFLPPTTNQPLTIQVRGGTGAGLAEAGHPVLPPRSPRRKTLGRPSPAAGRSVAGGVGRVLFCRPAALTGSTSLTPRAASHFHGFAVGMAPTRRPDGVSSPRGPRPSPVGPVCSRRCPSLPVLCRDSGKGRRWARASKAKAGRNLAAATKESVYTCPFGQE
jgi:hypothetical protein